MNWWEKDIREQFKEGKKLQKVSNQMQMIELWKGKITTKKAISGLLILKYQPINNYALHTMPEGEERL